MKRVKITERQLEEALFRESTRDIHVTTGNFDNMPLSMAVEITKKIAATNPGGKTTLNGQEIDSTTNVSQKATEIQNQGKEVSDGQLEECGLVYTKKQLKEARLKNLKKNSYSIKKKDLFK